MPAYSEEYMLTGLRQGGKKMEEVMAYIYLDHPCREQISSFIIKRNGTPEEAEDIFQDGIRILISQIQAGNYKGSGSITGYLFGICRKLWYKRFQKIAQRDQLLSGLPPKDIDPANPELIMMDKDQEEKLSQLMDLVGPTCRKVLELWKLSYSMKEIASELNYKNEAVARKKKRLCLKKLLDILEEQPQWKEWLK